MPNPGINNPLLVNQAVWNAVVPPWPIAGGIRANQIIQDDLAEHQIRNPFAVPVQIHPFENEDLEDEEDEVGFMGIQEEIPEEAADIIEFQGFQLKVPNWATFVGQLPDGSILFFENETQQFGNMLIPRGGRTHCAVRPEQFEVIIERI